MYMGCSKIIVIQNNDVCKTVTEFVMSYSAVNAHGLMTMDGVRVAGTYCEFFPNVLNN